MLAVHEIEVPISKDLNFTRDRVRWGPVLAGLFTALTTMVERSPSSTTAT